MKKSMLFLVVMVAFVLFSCGGTEGSLTLKLTDAPAEDDFEAIVVDFGSVMVSRSSSETTDESEWITISEDPGSIDLLTLTNGLTEELGTVSLPEGQYNQIRIIVEGVTVTVGGTEYAGTVNSGTVKLVKAFTLTDGVATELVADFNAAASVKKTGVDQYRITPVIKLQQVDLTGAISGKATALGERVVTVTAYSEYAGDDTIDSEAGTLADDQGNFKLGFLPAGEYDILIQAEGFNDYLIENQTVTVGEVLTLDPVVMVSAVQ